jgi:Na+/glutamate symporter
MDQNVFSNVSRVVTFVLMPILLPVSASVANWLQDVAGLNLTGVELAAFVCTVVAGVAVTGFKWVANRGDWERSVLYEQVANNALNLPVDDVDGLEDLVTGLDVIDPTPTRPLGVDVEVGE